MVANASPPGAGGAPDGSATERSVVAIELARMARLARIADAVRGEVIPRLLARDRGADRLAADIAKFAQLVLRPSPREADAFVARLRRDGSSAADLCTGLLAGTARHLGEQWTTDRLSCGDVALGTARLQRLLRTLSPTLAPMSGRRPGPVGGVAVLLATVPGEQHGFGLSMLAEFFRAEGWRVDLDTLADPDALEAALRRGRHDLLGLSIAGETHLPVLHECCARARLQRERRPLGLLVGGPLLTAHPELADALGADGTATAPADVLVLAERLVACRPVQAIAG